MEVLTLPRCFAVPVGSLRGLLDAGAGLARLVVELGDGGPVRVNQPVTLASSDGWRAHGRVKVAELGQTEAQLILVTVTLVEWISPDEDLRQQGWGVR
jgi:hypothetical protein